MHKRTVLVIILVAAYVAFYVLPSWSSDDEILVRPSNSPIRSMKSPTSRPQDETMEYSSHSSRAADLSKKGDDASGDDPPMLEAWGYNRERNIPRWKAIYKSIAKDHEPSRRNAPTTPFTIVDYGSDQGYFSISAANYFPQATVIGLEMGGVGGEIWNKGKKKDMDVLQIQEGHLERLGLTNMQICQTTMHQSHFFALKEAKAVSDYQFVLSVFHWFKLDTRRDFEKVLVTLLSNARTTFIELPTIGDNSALIRKQVGYDRFAKWYDGRTNVAQIIRESAAAENVEVEVELVLSFPWVRWTREVYRVDYVAHRGREISFECAQRRKIYGCKPREKFSHC